jgi:hypothetical protein
MKERWNLLDISFVYIFWAANSWEQALKSSFDIYPIHRFVYLFSAVASAVATPVFVDAVDVVDAVDAVDAVAAVVASRASRKQSTRLKLLVSVLGNSAAGL